MANGLNSILWHWTATPKPELPSWAQDPTLFNGTFQASSLAGPLQVLSNRAPQNAASTIGVASTSGKVTNGFIKALCRTMQLYQGTPTDGFGSNARYGIAEYTLSDTFQGNSIGLGSSVCVVYDSDTGVFMASQNGRAIPAKDLTSEYLFVAMWGFFLQDVEFQKNFDIITATSSEDEQKAAACVLANIAYYMTKENAQSAADLPVCEKKDVKSLSAVKINNAIYRPTFFKGHFSAFPVNGRSTSINTTSNGRAMPTSQFIGSFKFSAGKLTKEQQSLVPQIGEEYVVSDVLVDICKHIKETSKRSRPIRNILLRGEPGTGKTEIGTGIAAGCNLPKYYWAANAMSEPFDMFGSFVPVSDGNENSDEKLDIKSIKKDFPSIDDISMDAVFSYEKITGIYKPDATATDCISAIFQKVQSELDVSGQQQRYEFVPGQLIHALKNGGVWVLDEVTLPQNPGVIPVLNPCMDNTQSLTLPTGEVVKRHPDCIFVGTTNTDLEGCRRMNQAWQDRCQLIIDMEDPSDNELLTRIKSMTDFDDTEDAKIVDLDKFVNAYHQLKEIAAKRRLDDGVIGPRKLADWIASTLVTNDPIKSAKITIITGATTDRKAIAELEEKIADCF